MTGTRHKVRLKRQHFFNGRRKEKGAVLRVTSSTRTWLLGRDIATDEPPTKGTDK